MSPLNNWLLRKIATFLTTKEGVSVSASSAADKIEITDVFGFRYQIEIKAIGRIDQGGDDDGGYFKHSSGNFLSTSKVN